MKKKSVFVIGGGPAGLTAAYMAAQAGFSTIVLEKNAMVGGIARTEQFNGFNFDIGGHRFYTKDPEIQKLWETTLGNNLHQVDRLSRIFYQGRFFAYPIEVPDVLFKLGLVEIGKILWSYLKAKLRPNHGNTYEDWMINRFGNRLYSTFFKSYTEKVWGIPCSLIQADWASQRIRGLSLRSLMVNLIHKPANNKSLIPSFSYPVFGAGLMWRKLQEKINDEGGKVRMNSGVKVLEREGNHITRIITQTQNGSRAMPVDQIISSMPITDLVNSLIPKAPPEVLEAANNMRYRDFLLVGLIVNRADLFPDQWLYIHAPEVKAGRIQNYKNWSAEMVPNPGKTSLGIEYFCNQGDDMWEMADNELVDLAVREMVFLDLINKSEVEQGIVLRQPKAYPVYDENYHANISILRTFLNGFDNLQTIGRNGMHRYNNMDHSMLTAMLAVRNLQGEEHDLWDVNTDQEYGEIAQ